MADITVVKRNGKEVNLDVSKISNAIKKAFDSLDKNYNDNIIDFLALKVISDFQDKIKNGKVTVEDIQDSCKKVLSDGGYADVAKEYILYRKQREKIRNISKTTLDYSTLVDSYIKVNDWRVKENSTVTYSIGGLILSNSGAVTANYWLSEVYDDEIANAHRNADIHIHDLSMLSPYCAGWNLKQLIKEGLGGVTGKITSAPAKHLHTLCNQMVNFLGIMQNEWAGAQAFSSFDTYLAPFVKVDNLTYREVKQCIQSFIYGVNTPSRWGTQAPFTNVTLDWTVPDDLAIMPAIVGGKEMDFTYGDCKKEMDMVNKAFIEIMIEGDANGRGFQYPIPTYSITSDFDWSETENNKLLFEMTSKYGTPYFSNYINSDMSPSDSRSMCITADSMVWCKLNGKTKHITIEELYNSEEYSKQILTRFGYRDIKELQRFEYSGDLLEFTTETGKHITSTIDHEHVVYNREPSGRLKDIIKKKASELEVGDYFMCRLDNTGEKRYGKTFEELKNKYSKSYLGRKTCNKNVLFTDEVKEKISNSFKGNYISESYKKLSSHRFKGLYNTKDGTDTYRKYINRCEMITDIRKFSFNGFVYDLEVDCDDIDGDTTMYHTFYANEILTGNCCRLRLDLRELRKKSGGYFGSGESTGSVGVVTINLPRLGYLAKDEKDFYEKLDKIMDISARSLKIKRDVVTNLLEQGLYPYAKRYLGTFNNHFSTMATIGMNEMCLNAKWLNKDMTHVEAQEFTKEVLNHMRERLSDYQELYGDLYNLEAAPAESTTYRLAKHDKKLYPNIITANGDCGTPYYTNSSHLPVDYTADIFEALDIQDDIQTLYTSGTVFHGFLGEKLPDWKAALNLVRKIAENYKLPYYTLSPTYSVCKNHGYISGEKYECDDCGEKTEVYSRITGYYRPVQNWNDGKLEEFNHRKTYNKFEYHNHSNDNHSDIDSDEDFCDVCQINYDELQPEKSYKLFATKTCPKCKVAAQLLEKKNIEYEKVYVEDNTELAKSLELKQAPTLVILENDLVTEKIQDLPNIKSYIDNI